MQSLSLPESIGDFLGTGHHSPQVTQRGSNSQSTALKHHIRHGGTADPSVQTQREGQGLTIAESLVPQERGWIRDKKKKIRIGTYMHAHKVIEEKPTSTLKWEKKNTHMGHSNRWV